MKKYFVDTSYWQARSDPSDALHARAKAFDKELGPNVRLITTDLVLVEWLNAVSRFGVEARNEVVRQIKRMDETDEIQVIRQDELHVSFCASLLYKVFR